MQSPDWMMQELRHLRTKPFTMGNVIDVDQTKGLKTEIGPQFQASKDQLARHQVVMGTTGSGKSKYLELFGRHLIDQLCGFTYIDPHGDVVEALMAYATMIAEQKGDGFLLERLHYLKPTYESVFSFDPLHFPDTDIPNSQRPIAEATWLDSTVDRLARAFLRAYSQSEIDVMRRLKRWLKNMLTGVGTRLNDGSHLSLADIFVLLDQRHKRHKEVFNFIRDRLPHRDLADFELIHSIKRQQDEDHYLESTVNTVDDFFSPLVEAIFTNDVPSIDIRKIIENNHILLVNLKEARFGLSEEQGVVIAGLIINEITSVCSQFEEEERPSHTHHLIIDEAGYYIAEDLRRILERARKWGLSLCLGGQSLSTFRKGDVDVFESIQDNCTTFISFQQRNNESVRDLGEFFAYPNRDLSERMDVRDRPGGHELITLRDHSFGEQSMKATSKSRSHSNMIGGASQIGKAISHMESLMRQKSHSTTELESWNESTSDSTSNQSGAGIGDSAGHSPTLIDGNITMLPTSGQNVNHYSSSALSQSRQRGVGGASGQTFMEGEGLGEADGITLIESEANSFGESDTDMEAVTYADSESSSITYKQTLVPVTYEEQIPTGQPRRALDYQNDIYSTLLTNLPDQYFLVRMKDKNAKRDRSFLVRTSDVHPAYASSSEKREKVKAFTDRLLAEKPYMIHNPQLPHLTQKERIDQLLNTENHIDKSLPQNQDTDSDAPFPNS